MPEVIFFENQQKERLVGKLHTIKTASKDKIVILVHGFTSAKGDPLIKRIAEEVEQANLNCFCFDFSGHGNSEGSFSDITYTKEAGDLKSAMDHLGKAGYSEFGVIAHSMGATVTFIAASVDKRIKVIVDLSGKVLTHNPSKILFTEKNLGEMRAQGWTMLQTRLGPKRLNRSFLDDSERINVLEIAKHLTLPVAIIHGDADVLIPIEESQQLYPILAGKKQFTTIEGADHHFTKHRDQAARAAVEWIKRFM